MTAVRRSSGERIRDLIMIVILAVWTVYAFAAVVQVFTSGAKVLESLPPFWFWGLPIAPYTAMYLQWPGRTAPDPPAPPEPSTAPAAPAGPAS